MLHREVYWLGKQWAVTGYGVQAVSNKLEMKFDIEATRIWDDGLDDAVRAQPWFDPDDFAQALSVARQRLMEAPLSFRLPLSDER